MALSKEEQPPLACVLWFQVACTKRRLFLTRNQGGIRDDTFPLRLRFGGSSESSAQRRQWRVWSGTPQADAPPRRGSQRAKAARAMALPGSAGAAAPPARQRCSGPTSWRPAAQREASPGATQAGPRGQPSSAAGSDGFSLAGAAAADPLQGLDAALARGREGRGARPGGAAPVAAGPQVRGEQRGAPAAAAAFPSLPEKALRTSPCPGAKAGRLPRFALQCGRSP